MPVPRTSPAVANARLRYAPQRQALAQAAQEARAEREAAIAGAQSESRLNQNAIQHAVPNVQGIYQRAQDSSGAMHSQLAAALSALPGVAPFQAAAGTEAAQGGERTARERASAESALGAQALAAASAPAFATTLANQHLGSTLSKILSQGNALNSQEGAAIGTNLDSERKEASRNALTERGQNITLTDASAGRQQKAQEHREDLAFKAAHPSGGATVGGVKQLSTDKQASAAEALRGLEGKTRQLWKTHSPAQIYQELTATHPAYSENVPKKDSNGQVVYKLEKVSIDKAGKPVYKKVPELEKVTYPEIKPANPLLVQAAIESATKYGRISKATLVKLHKAGYSIKSLDLQPPNEKGASSAPATAPAGRGNERRSTAGR